MTAGASASTALGRTIELQRVGCELAGSDLYARVLAAVAGAVCAGGCRVFDGAAGASALGPNYWCTWATQARMLNANVEAGEIKFPGDQGKPGVRDNLNEEVLFGKNGFANVMYPELRADLFFLLDDGWDVPYGINPYAHTAKFGSLNLNPDRFPSFKGSPGERLRQLVDRGLQTLLPSLEVAYPWALAILGTSLFAGLGIARRVIIVLSVAAVSVYRSIRVQTLLRQHAREVLGGLAHQLDEARDYAAAADTVRRLMFVERLQHDIDEALEALEE